MTDTQEIKARLDIVDIISEQVQLRKSGRNYAGFCPFHSNTRTPAFYVFPETQTWRCFGACAEGGDVFSYVMKKEGWDFKEALEHLARRAGVTLEPAAPVDRQKKALQDRLGDLITAATDYFHQLFLHAPQAEAARAYIAKRGLSDETIAAFQLGFALDSWDACRTHFSAQGYSDDDLLAAGLLTENEERGTRYDRFRNRLMIPIRDGDGRVVGFGARTLDPDGIPKYLNSPQTPLFDKSSILFGLSEARRHIREARQAVIVEGYMDVMQGWQAGYRNMVAQMGTALTETQLTILKRYTKSFVIALDADAAGVKATMRSLQVARETLDREVEVRFDARGLVRHEGRLKAEIKIVTLPEGTDPDNIIRADPTQWPVVLAQARAVVAYVIDMATRDLDLGDPKAKSAVAQQVLPLISDVADPIEREHYRQQLARALRVDERTLRQVVVTEKPIPYQPPEPEAPPMEGVVVPNGRGRVTAVRPRPIATHLREANLLRQCLAYPRILIDVNQRLERHGQRPLHTDDFAVVEDRTLFPLIVERASQPSVVTIDELCDSLDAVLAGRIRSLQTLPVSPESEHERLADRLVLSILDWRSENVREQVAQLQQLFVVAQAQGDTSVDFIQMRRQLLDDLGSIDRAKNAMTAAGRRKEKRA